jgi:hypothetical protein
MQDCLTHRFFNPLGRVDGADVQAVSGTRSSLKKTEDAAKFGFHPLSGHAVERR